MGDSKIQDILHDIDVVENGILLQHDVHDAFRTLAWEIKTKTENGSCRYFIKAGSSFTAKTSERERNCNFLTSPAMIPRTQMSALSTLLSPLSLPPAVRQKFSTDSSNIIRTSSVLN